MIILNVPYAEKDHARRLGAKWDYDRKTWYVPEGWLLSSFERWLPEFRHVDGGVIVQQIPMVAMAAASLATPGILSSMQS